MTQQIEVPPQALAREIDEGTDVEIAPDLAYKRLAIVNVIFIGAPGAGDRGWVLVDAGIPGSAEAIRRAAAARFGAGARPRAIVLTHAHFDHTGVLRSLAEDWDVPVYAHPLERPYLDGSAAYPPPDPSVGGGLLALLSPLYPRGPLDIADRLRDLPADGTLPPLPGWRAVPTPGHSPGHISLWRERDRVLVAGDAFVTTAQESAYAVAAQVPEIHGPPRYLTPDWSAARQSVVLLAGLEPELAVTGHGRPMQGPELRAGLRRLAERFDVVAVPPRGRYVSAPARAEDGSAYRDPYAIEGSRGGYRPFDVPKAVAQDVWIVDAAPIRAGGLPLPLRMTVIRLPDGSLLLHSPTPYRAELDAALSGLGRVAHIVAPSFGHWMFLARWQRAHPEAKTWAVPGLKDRGAVRKSSVRIDAELDADAPSAWGEAITLVPIDVPGFAEVELFHRPSRTLVLTDLVLNLESPGFTFLTRLAAQILGICAPDGEAPLYLRLLLSLDRRRVAEAAARLVAFDPERVIFAHGRWFDHDGTAALRRSLAWILGPAGSSLPGRAARGPLAGAVVVIVGASSGIGRATALAFARQGARLVLAARRSEVLDEVVRQVEASGGEARAVTTDVTDAEAVERLAEAAMSAFGRIDIWFNNAGTGVFAPLQAAPLDLHRRTIEVNLLGTIYGSYAVLPIFLRQGRGTLINMVSMGGWSPMPFASAYSASKFGLRGFTASLRQELADHPDIHVCGVFPAMIDTPGFVHGANLSGRRLDPGPWLYRAGDVADVVVGLATWPRDEAPVGRPAHAARLAFGLAPRATETLMGAGMRSALRRARPERPSEGSIRAPILDGTEREGGWLRRKRLPSARTIERGIIATGLAGLAIGAAVLALRARRPARA